MENTTQYVIWTETCGLVAMSINSLELARRLAQNHIGKGKNRQWVKIGTMSGTVVETVADGAK